MVLAELRSYLAEHKRVALGDMAHRFDTDADALRGMLAVWERKGRVRKLPTSPACSGCCQCDPASLEIYEWVGTEKHRVQ